MSSSGPPSDDLPSLHGRTELQSFAWGKSPNVAGEMVGRDNELARVRALLEVTREGARLRRSGQRVKARERLRTADEAFEEMDLTAWVLHAADELAATGAKPRTRRPQATEPLTSQETWVALHAANGMSNKEIAGALFPSPKTGVWHA